MKIKTQTIESPHRLLILSLRKGHDLVFANVIRKPKREGTYLELLCRSADTTIKLPAGDWEIFGKLQEFRADHETVWGKSKVDLHLIPENTLVLVDSNDATFYPKKKA